MAAADGKNGHGKTNGDPAPKPPKKPKGLKPGDQDENGHFVKGNSQEFQPGNEFGKMGGRPRKRSYAKAYEDEAKKLCKTATWAVAICKRLGLDPNATTIGSMLVQSDQFHRATGKAEFAKMALDRTEGRVPDTMIHETGMSVAERRSRIESMLGIELPDEDEEAGE